MTDFLVFEGLTKAFGPIKAVDDVSLVIGKGEFYSLLGPSGCGKTTLLRMLAGFEQPAAGRILLDGEDITRLPPNKRKVNTIFQNYALFPHLSVWENIAFGLKVARRPAAEIRHEVDHMLELMQMEDHAHKRPGQISGGQKQRVAIARALINKPRILLLDEPLAALDLKLRQRMLVDLDVIHDEVGITFIYVTHDQGEAMSLSDRIAVMNHGRIEQVGSPTEIYEAPRSSFVAAFIGDTNFLEGTVRALAGEEYCLVDIEGLTQALCYNDKKLQPGSPVFLSMRPEKFSIARDAPATGDPKYIRLRGRVEDVMYLGSHTRFWVRVGDYKIAISQQHNRFMLDEKPIRWNEEVWIWWHADDGFMLENYSPADEELVSLPAEETEDAVYDPTSVPPGDAS